jgi:hypothetical protein
MNLIYKYAYFSGGNNFLKFIWFNLSERKAASKASFIFVCGI